jgi:hypothetical protein
MPEEKDTDLSEVVPPAAPLIGDPADPDQVDTATPLGAEEGMRDDRRRRDEQA